MVQSMVVSKQNFSRRPLLVVKYYTVSNTHVALGERTQSLVFSMAVVELKVFVVWKALCFAFARLVYVNRPSWLRTDSDCGRLCSNIWQVSEIESALQIVRLDDITDKFVVITNESTSVDTIICQLPNTIDRD